MPLLKANKAKIILVLAYVTFIYATLPVMRPVLGFLKAQLGSKFDFFIDLALISSMAGLVIMLGKSKISWKQWLLAFVVFCFYAYSLDVLKIPEERIHLLEYGLLSYLVFGAYPAAWSIASRCWLTFLMVSLLGTVDEVIQYFLPNRVGDIRDVLLNMISGLFGLILTALIQQKPAKNLPNSPAL